MKIRLVIVSVLFLFLLWPPSGRGESHGKAPGPRPSGVPILLYHRFGPVASDSMTVPTDEFESQLKYLGTHGYIVVSLRQLVDHSLGKGPPPPPKSVILTADDGHRSVYRDMLPLLKKYRVSATLFIYPSAISNANYAMTWSQLREMKETGLIDLQSHTYWHPNFKKERESLQPFEYDRFVEMQLKKSKEKLERELNTKVDMLAWPFGISNDELIDKALASGYVATLTMERQPARITDSVRSLPRYLMTHSDKGAIERIMISGFRR
jgi:peptidoglycan/xylan/chitin deacetylase (PgdA/CDA1 family)